MLIVCAVIVMNVQRTKAAGQQLPDKILRGYTYHVGMTDVQTGRKTALVQLFQQLIEQCRR